MPDPTREGPDAPQRRLVTVLVDPEVYATLQAVAAAWTANGHTNTPESVASTALGPAVLDLAERHGVEVPDVR